MPLARTAEAIKAYIELHSEHSGPHLIYHGRPKLHFDSKQVIAARLYWRLTYGEQPSNSWLLKLCKEPNCIEPDCWGLSAAPAVYIRWTGKPKEPEQAPVSSAATLRALKALRASHEAHGAALATLEAALGIAQ